MLLLFVSGCVEFFAVQFAPDRVPERSDTPESEAARQAFWTAFTHNDLASIPQVRADLTAEYLEHPQDASLARLLGHLHFWTFVERDRLPWTTDASITDHVVISEHYFEQAALLAPDDHRMHAWWGGDKLVIGGLRGDEAEIRRGYFEVKRGIDGYPAYNLVTAGFVFAVPPKDAPPFVESVEALWQALEQCAGQPIDRDAFDVAPIVNRSPLPPRDQGEVCWNGERWPYNQQGILFQLAEVLIKNHEPARAKQVLEQLKTTPDYASWPRRAMVDDRLQNADAYADQWDAGGEEPPFLVNSGHSCTVCHAVQDTPTPAEPTPAEPAPEPDAPISP